MTIERMVLKAKFINLLLCKEIKRKSKKNSNIDLVIILRYKMKQLEKSLTFQHYNSKLFGMKKTSEYWIFLVTVRVLEHD